MESDELKAALGKLAKIEEVVRQGIRDGGHASALVEVIRLLHPFVPQAHAGEPQE